jgi:diadenylate cyclase
MEILEVDARLIRQVFDTLVVAFIIYRGLLIIKGTRAAPMLGGLAVLMVLFVFSKPLGLNTLAWLLGNFLSQIILIVIVLFQDEIRRGLTKVGLQPIFGKFAKPIMHDTLDEVSLACASLSRERLGALIVIQQEVGLDEIAEEGVTIDAKVDRKLIHSIFIKESPLHDGAMLIQGPRVAAAGCVLPLTQNPDLDPTLGTRHRAAIGISERSDAIIIVVSEENGGISMVREGRITRNLDASTLRDALHRLITTHEIDSLEELSGEESGA